jgi:hypothetical protein
MNSVYLQVDNVLPKQFFEILQERVTSKELPWFWTGTYYTELYDPDQYFYHLWAHTASGINISRTYISELLETALLISLDKTGQRLNTIIRSRIGMSTITKERLTHRPHIDLDLPHRTGLLYIDESESPTYFYNELYDPSKELTGEEYYKNVLNEKVTIATEIKPSPNKFICFDGYRYHSSTSPTKEARRIVINYNYTATDI